jgi:SAM-dependent methyltransferase
MTTIYQNYQDEPDPLFLPLPEDLACLLYSLEMDGFTDDIAFYRTMLPAGGAVLEMGCGTGRVARGLAGSNRPVTGIDISLPMVRQARKHLSPHCTFLCMDMLAPAFSRPFEAIVIPYNTLNLFPAKDHILRGLIGCKSLLTADGVLLVQLFIPTEEFRQSGKTTFQFQLFDRPEGGRIVKEILNSYRPESQTVALEERFRIRPMQKDQKNEDYRRITTLAGYRLDQWLALFGEAGFFAEQQWGSFDRRPYDPALSSCCLFILRHQENFENYFSS